MSLDLQRTFICDNCDTEYMMPDYITDMPPGWISVQVVMSSSKGMVPERETDIYYHYCGLTCLAKHLTGDTLKTRFIMANETLKNDKE